MEISPIPGIRAVTALQPLKNDAQLPAIVDIESASGSQQDSFSRTGRETSGGQGGEAAEQDEQVEPMTNSCEDDAGSIVNLIA
jgi:hypothetical protein